jgi:hypothetical protein
VHDAVGGFFSRIRVVLDELAFISNEEVSE